ncbi:CvpA family protein [Sphingomonas sp.]|uniref:CvpA family protein n=1 Tax=Sphingomonas sp. TaxID=28214 RepID=UPI0025D11005|nr:CvpA family protein [Sphingomonas sp.]
MTGLTGLDVLVLLIVAAAAVFGFLRGFVSETMSLAAWVLAILAVKMLHAPVAAALVDPIGTDTGASVLAFALVFGATFIAVRMVGGRLGSASRRSLLGPVDRLLGFGFGALKGVIVATLAFLFASLVFDTLHGASQPRPAWMTTSRTYPLLRASSAALVDFVERRRAE